MSAAMGDRSHLSIGEVLSLLQDDFPDVTISKIRFLESQGLLDPERTPSGYRKFYEPDIDRLRWILRHQREHFLPLKVIRDRLDEAARAGLDVPPDEPPPPAPAPSLFEASPTAAPGATGPVEGSSVAAADAAERAPAAAPARLVSEGESQVAAPAAPEPVSRPARPARRTPTLPPLPAPTTDGPSPIDPGPSSISMSLEELSEATGLTQRELGDLERFGLLAGYQVGGDTFYDGDALVVARSAAGFLRFGIEARHLRMYKVAAEREAGFMEQVIMPLLKQRNPTARQQAAENLGEMARLGEQLRAALLRTALQGHTGQGR